MDKKMITSRKNYQIAIFYNTIQIVLITLLINNNYMKRLNYFQPKYTDMIELFIGIIVFMINICVIFVIKGLYKSAREEEEAKMSLLKYRHIEEETRIYLRHKHDLKNHMLIISQLIQEKEYERLEDYLLLYQKNIDNSIIHIETGMKELDVLFYSKVHRARENDIQVKFKCSSKIHCSKQSVLDLISILSNVLDNALDACEAVQIEKVKCIEINIEDNVIDYRFRVSNTFFSAAKMDIEKIFESGFSTKGDHRGEGLYILKKKVEKYEGNILTNIKNNYFEITIEIPKYAVEEKYDKHRTAV